MRNFENKSCKGQCFLLLAKVPNCSSSDLSNGSIPVEKREKFGL